MDIDTSFLQDALPPPVFGPPTLNELLFSHGSYLQGEDEFMIEYGQERYKTRLENHFSPFEGNIHVHVNWPDHIPPKARDHAYR